MLTRKILAMRAFALQLASVGDLKNTSYRLSQIHRDGLQFIASKHGQKPVELVRTAVGNFLADYAEKGWLAVGLPPPKRPDTPVKEMGAFLEAVATEELARRDAAQTPPKRKRSARKRGDA